MIIRKAQQLDAEGIFYLFKKNYPAGYYSNHFTSIENIEKLILSDTFIGIIVLINDKIVAFSGLYIEISNNDYLRIYLSNYLVDVEYRCQGIGSKIEEEKEKIFNSFNKKILVYSYVIPRTMDSLKVKLKYGYMIWGIKMFYGELEPSPIGNGHLFVLGKLINYEEETINLPPLNEITKTLINSLEYNSSFNSTSYKKNTTGFTIIYPKDVLYGQYTVSIKPNSEKTFNLADFELLISSLKTAAKENPYTSIRIPTSLSNLIAIDHILIDNNFLPTSFLPFFEDNTHIIEYQYIDKTKISKISKKIANFSFIMKNFSI